MSACNNVICEEFDEESHKEISKVFTAGYKYAWYGEGRYVLADTYKDHADNILQFEVRPQDVWVATYPRTGTTWTQEMVWLIANDLNYEGAKELITKRYAFLEVLAVTQVKLNDEENASNEKYFLDYRDIEDAPSPRFIKTHLPMSLLPPAILNSKVVYVTRDPRNVAVSYYHHNKLFKITGCTGDFKGYWNLFRKDLLVWSPFFKHTKEAWALRDHPNMLFLFYEDMAHDLPSVAKRVAKFLNKSYTDEQIAALCEHLKFDNMKQNKAAHPEWMQNSPMVDKNEEGFFRKGKVGGWEKYFDEEMRREAEQYIEDNLKGTDFKFPTYQ